jgi:hypothetical protein
MAVIPSAEGLPARPFRRLRALLGGCDQQLGVGCLREMAVSTPGSLLFVRGPDCSNSNVATPCAQGTFNAFSCDFLHFPIWP